MNKKYNYGIVHYWNYFKASFRVSFLSMTEYKVNFYNSVLVQLFFISIPLLFGYVLIGFIGDSIGWNFTDYLIFFYNSKKYPLYL